MKPRKKLRIENEGNAEDSIEQIEKKEKKEKKPRPVEVEESGSEEEFVDEFPEVEDEDEEAAIEEGDNSEDNEEEDDDFADVKSKKRKKQAKDPASFANAMSAILSSSLKAHTRADPILVRAKTHSQKLESEKEKFRIQKAISAQRKALRSIGHVEDLTAHDGKEIEYERIMKKTAQRGVVKLFNAIRASQIKAEEALAQAKGVPRGEREEKVKEMSREGFLNLIKSG